MGEVIKLRSASQNAKRQSVQEMHKGKTLCRSGFHKWEVVQNRPFDVKEGKLVSRYSCPRCGATRVETR
jgi:transposase-like protein